MEPNQIDTYLKTLSLHRIREIYQQEAENAANTKLAYQDYLLRLLEQQVLSKIDRSINRKIQLAAFPSSSASRNLTSSISPRSTSKLIRELASLDFLKSRQEHPVRRPARCRENSSGDRAWHQGDPGAQERVLLHGRATHAGPGRGGSLRPA